MEREEADRETAVYPSESGEPGIGGVAGTVGVEQFPGVCLWRKSKGEGEFSGVGGADQTQETGGVWGGVRSIVTPLNRTERD